MLGMYEQQSFFPREHRSYLRIHFTDHIFRPDHRGINAADSLLQESDIAVSFRDHPFPVPLVDIQGMQIAQLLICPDGIHIGIDPISRLDTVFSQRKSFPFGKGMHDFRLGICHILDPERYRTLHSVEIIVDSHPFEDEKRGGHPAQPEF